MIKLLSDKIKKLRQKSNLQQKDLVEYLKVAKSTYSQYESGDRVPSLDIIRRIAEFYNVPTDYLLEHQVVKNKESKHEEMKEVLKRELGPGVEIHFQDASKIDSKKIRAIKAVWDSLKDEDEE